MSTHRGGRKAPTVNLSDLVRKDLERYARARTTSQGLAQRSRIILLCAADKKRAGDLSGAARSKMTRTSVIYS